MRVMVLVKSDPTIEAGALPDAKALAEMGKFNEALAAAGVLIAGEGLHASADGVRLRFGGGAPTVTRGPFPEVRQLVAGFWLWKVASLDDAIAWLKRAPFPPGGELEIRPLMELEDFGAAATPEVRAQEERIRAQVASREAAHH